MKWITDKNIHPKESGLYHVKISNGRETWNDTQNYTLDCWEVDDEGDEIVAWLDESPVSSTVSDREAEIQAEELFDKHSTLIGDRIDELDYWANRNVVTEKDFKAAIVNALSHARGNEESETVKQWVQRHSEIFEEVKKDKLLRRLGDWLSLYDETFIRFANEKVARSSGNEGVLVAALEKLKKEMSNVLWCWDNDTFQDHDIDDARSALKQAIQALATYKHGDRSVLVDWVRVDGKNFPPKNDKYYYWLYSESLDNYEIGDYDHDFGYFKSNTGDQLVSITHWALPQPPSNQ